MEAVSRRVGGVLSAIDCRGTWAMREGLALIALVVVYAALRTVAECFRFSCATRLRERGGSFGSLLQLEQAVWHQGPWQGVALYEVTDAFICVTQSYGSKLITAYGLGYQEMSQGLILVVSVGTGLAYSATETGSRLTEGAVGDGLKILSYVLAWIGWFLVLPLIYRRLTARLECDGPNLAFASVVNMGYLVCVCAMRIWGIEGLEVVSGGLVLVQLCLAFRQIRFHTMGYLLCTVSWYACFPSFSIESTKALQARLPHPFLKVVSNCAVSFLSQLFLCRIAQGSLAPHSGIVACFTVQFMEHLWSKIILLRETAFTAQWFLTAAVPLAHIFLQGSLVEQQCFRLASSPLLRRLIGDRLIVGQATWKEVMLTELHMLKGLSNCFADILAASCVITICVVQTCLVDRWGFHAAFDFGGETRWDGKLLGLLCIVAATLMLGAACRRTCERQLGRSTSSLELARRERLAEDRSMGSDVDPITYIGRHSSEELGAASVIGPYIAESASRSYIENYSMFSEPQLTAQWPALSMHVSPQEAQELVWKIYLPFFGATCVYITGQVMYDVTRIDELIA